MNIPGIGRSIEAIRSAVKEVNLDDTPLKNASFGNFANAASGVALNGPVLGPILGANEVGKRELTGEERQLVDDVFGDSIDLDRVTINEASVGAIANGEFNDGNARPFVTGNTVNYAKPIDLDNPVERATFLHEMTHVWQFQNTEGAGVQRDGAIFETRDGAVKIGKAILGDRFDLLDGVQTGTHYDVDTTKLDDVENFKDFNIEQQAEIVAGYELLKQHYHISSDLEKLEAGGISTDEELAEKQLLEDYLSQIENKGVYKDFHNAGVKPEKLEKFLTEIQMATPTDDGIAYEANEAFDEIINSPVPGWEVTEGVVEVGAESVESAAENIYRGGRNAVDEGRNAVGNALDEVASFPWHRLR